MAPMIKAIQELTEQNKRLNNRIIQLENKLDKGRKKYRLRKNNKS